MIRGKRNLMGKLSLCVSGGKDMEKRNNITITKMERNRIYVINKIALIVCFVVMSLFFMGMKTLASEVTPMTQTGYTTSDLNVRSGPGKDFDIIGTLKNGDVVNITGQTSTGWYQIIFEGSEGFASNQYIVIGEMENESEPTVDEADDSYNDNKESKDKYVSQRTIKAVKLIGIIIVIVIILIMIAFTMRGIQNDQELYDDFDDDLLEYSEEHQKNRNKTNSKNSNKKKASSGEVKKKESSVVKEKKIEKEIPEPVVIREEDYQLHIDPSIFEEENKIPQPERVSEEVSKEDLDRAMKKLNELQEEIDRLKKEQGK